MAAFHSRRSFVRRIVVAAVLAVALVAAATVDLGRGPAGPNALFAPAFSVSPQNSDSSTWYCAVPRLDKAPGVSIGLELTNLSPHAQRASVDFYSGSGKDLHKTYLVLAGSTLPVVWAVPASKPGGVEVTFAGGGNVVGMVATGSQGYSQLLCQPSPGPQWLVEGLSTQGASTAALAVFNPFAADAIVDIAFLTPSGQQQPGPLQAIVVGAHSTKEVYLPDWVQGTGPIAAQVTTRIGRVVAGAVEVRSDPSASGVVLAPVSAEVFTSYDFPLLSATANQAVALQLYNLSGTQQTAKVSVHPLSPVGGASVTTTTVASSTTAQVGSPRFNESVPAQGTISIPLKTIASVPIGTPFSMHVSGEVVAMVVVKGSTAGPLVGLFEEPGVKLSWHRWLELLYGPPASESGSQVAMVSSSNAKRGSGLVEPFYFVHRALSAQLSGIDNVAGVPFVVDRNHVQLFQSKFPGGLPTAFTISTSSDTVPAMALIGSDGSLTPFSQIPVD